MTHRLRIKRKLTCDEISRRKRERERRESGSQGDTTLADARLKTSRKQREHQEDWESESEGERSVVTNLAKLGSLLGTEDAGRRLAFPHLLTAHAGPLHLPELAAGNLSPARKEEERKGVSEEVSRQSSETDDASDREREREGGSETACVSE